MLPCRRCGNPADKSRGGKGGLCSGCLRVEHAHRMRAQRSAHRQLSGTVRVCAICGGSAPPLDAHHLTPLRQGGGGGEAAWAHPSCHRGAENRRPALG